MGIVECDYIIRAKFIHILLTEPSDIMKFLHQLTMLVAIMAIVICISDSTAVTTICIVDEDRRGDIKGCSLYTTTLENATLNLGDFSSIKFHKNHTTLNSLITINETTNVSIVGTQETTVIECENSSDAGMEFHQVANLTIENIVLDGCSGKVYRNILHSSIQRKNHSSIIRSALLIINSANVYIGYSAITSSIGTGFAAINTSGEVVVVRCNFTDNLVMTDVDVDGENNEVMKSCGVYIQLNDINKTSYHISFSNFTRNNASIQYNYRKYIPQYPNNFRDIGTGGGLSVILLNNTDSVSIIIHDCWFIDNEAMDGGGMGILFVNSSSNSLVYVKDVLFIENKSRRRGGGGVYIESIFPKESLTFQNNSIQFEKCDFVNNWGKYGGGVALKSSHSTRVPHSENRYIFKGCNWTSNQARFGSAIDINKNPYEMTTFLHLPTPVLQNCTFDSNKATPWNSDHEYYAHGIGTLMITGFRVSIKGYILFKNNTDSAVYLVSSTLQFHMDSCGKFENNSGFEGGAISSIGFSSIELCDSTELIFDGNTAERRGGAIFHQSSDQHDETSSRNCFFKYKGEEKVFERNVSVIFIGNGTDKHENSIHFTSLRPCIYYCRNNFNITKDTIFSCIGNFSFENENLMITSLGKYLRFNDEMLEVIPGEKLKMSINLTDDLRQPAYGTYYIKKENPQSSIDVDQNYYSTNLRKKLRIYGTPGDTTNLVFSKLGFYLISAKVRVRMVQCPPGYIFSGESQKCKCGTSRYKSVVSCNKQEFNANIRRGYWIGYNNEDNNSLTMLIEGNCPKYYCHYNKLDEGIHVLPNKSSMKLLEESLCYNRRGRLCGKCIDGHSVFLHNDRYMCSKNHLCKVGWLLYIMSELLPLTIIFIVVIICDISFTSGYATGLIFYAQAFDSLLIHSNNFISIPYGVKKLIEVNRILYSFFNFDFFNSEYLSFCIWEGALTPDVLIFKFVTVLYALFLIFITIWLMNAFNIHRRCSCLRIKTERKSVIHGLSAFLVMVYAQCTKISFRILDYTDLFAENATEYTRVLAVDGSVDYMSGRHLVYAIPAILCIATLTTIPPLLLITFPLVFKILDFLRIKESNKLHKVLQYQMLKIKPFLDSFQGCFKDNFRFFAGLYFIYRVTLILAGFHKLLSDSYTNVQLQLTTMILIHALAQPYQKRSHNFIDSFLFFNLMIINSITLYNHNFSKSDYFYYGKHTLNFTASIQVILISLPPLLVIVFIIYYIIKKLKEKFSIKKLSDNHHFLDEPLWSKEDMPARLLDVVEDSFSSDYEYYKNNY